MDIFERVDRLELDHDLLVYKEIQPMFANLMIAIKQRYQFLSNKRNSTESELNRQSLLVNRF